MKTKNRATADVNGIANFQVSVDGTWQKCACSSLNGEALEAYAVLWQKCLKQTL